MNFLLFLVFQFVAEPWRRRRLVKGVVEEEKAVLGEVRAELEAVRASLARREESVAVELPGAAAAVEDAPPLLEVQPPPLTWSGILSDPSTWRPFVVDLTSDRRIELSMRDVSLLALEGVVAGAAVAGTVALLVVRGR